MPGRTPNRPRIAGQRRTPAAPPAETEVEADVTPATPEAAEAEVKVPQQPPAATEGKQSEPTEPAKPAEPAGATEPAEAAVPREGKQGLGNLLTVALAIVVVLTLGVAVLLGIKAWHGNQAEDARSQAAAAGRKAAETALSYDYRDLDKSFAAARATMTPDFAAKFDETAKVAGELATKTKATVKADVREVGVRDGDADRVTLIIFVNQTTTSTITQGKPRVDLNRTRFTMVRNGGRWLVQEIAGL
ncbi:hypothetical protein GCM10009804_19110 [Kribbella hippodromi]|uniref:Mce-associated membrane protein n=1 Tax=Kribbella hippodromi TaxID=434347 RepID=A0ABP4NLR5_9ACTN